MVLEFSAREQASDEPADGDEEDGEQTHSDVQADAAAGEG